jgi:2-keto-4-pentenoate hydratase/2-oxohepta-3-ene-1,7-dioic acid hydratase in catechol pathway
MTQAPERQHWVLLGTAPASEEVWGLRRIEFPCGYFMPTVAYAAAGQPLRRPAQDSEAWAMGGFALELGRGGKSLSKKDAPACVAGYRPWVALFRNALIDELTARQHTIQVWDRGVSIFYGLWQERSQALGELIPADQFSQLMREPAELQIAGGKHRGVAAAEYAHDAASIIPFMSDFMTLSPGDIYVQGPLVAQPLGAGVSRITLVVGKLRFDVEVA